MISLLNRYALTSFDIMGNLPPVLSAAVLSYLRYISTLQHLSLNIKLISYSIAYVDSQNSSHAKSSLANGSQCVDKKNSTSSSSGVSRNTTPSPCAPRIRARAARGGYCTTRCIIGREIGRGGIRRV